MPSRRPSGSSRIRRPSPVNAWPPFKPLACILTPAPRRSCWNSFSARPTSLFDGPPSWRFRTTPIPRSAAAYRDLPEELREPALTLLASRGAWARNLFTEEDFPLEDLGENVLTRLMLHEDPVISAALAQRLPENDGTGRQAPLIGERLEAIRSLLAAAPGDPYRGEALYEARCAACHRLFHKGGNIGPDLTAYQREDLDTLLPSLISPSAEVREGYKSYLLKTSDGRVYSGFLTETLKNEISLRTYDGSELTFQRDALVEFKAASRSLMPDGLLGDDFDPLVSFRW